MTARTATAAVSAMTDDGRWGPAMIAVTVNGESRTVPVGASLAELVALLTPAPHTLATAVNSEFVAREARGERRLKDGDVVFTFQPITGG